MAGNEKTYENKVKKHLQSVGAWEVKFFGCAYTRAGVPDVLSCYKGKFIGIEVKADTGKPSQLQLHEIEQIKLAGGKAFVLYPSAFEDFKTWLADGAETDPPVIWKNKK